MSESFNAWSRSWVKMNDRDLHPLDKVLLGSEFKFVGLEKYEGPEKSFKDIPNFILDVTYGGGWITEGLIRVNARLALWSVEDNDCNLEGSEAAQARKVYSWLGNKIKTNGESISDYGVLMPKVVPPTFSSRRNPALVPNVT